MLPRVLVLLLLAMNIGAAAWWLLRTPPQPATIRATEPDVPSLKLLGESEVAAPAPALATSRTGAASPQDRCLSIGPFLTQADLRGALAALTPHVNRIQHRETRSAVNRGWWVFLPAVRSREQALALARQLSAAGLRDYYVVTAGERENTVSLGLFREERNAQTRLREVQSAGFEARVEARLEETPQHWVDLAADADFDWRARLPGRSGIDASPIECFPPGRPPAQ